MKHNVLIPSVGESIQEVYIGHWLKQTGDIVKKDEILVDLETQKASFELQAEVSGKIEVLKPEPETKLMVGDVVAIIDDAFANDAATSGTATKETPKAAASNDSGPILSPAARKAALEKNVDISQVSGSGKDGRITKEDLSKPVSKPSPQPSVAATTPSAPSAAAINYQVDVARGERRQPATRIRRQIAQNLVAAQHTAAILTTFNEVDMTQILEFRKKHKDEFKTKYGVPLGIVSFFALAAVRALKEFNIVNCTFTGEDIIYRDFVDISVAVSTDRGLVVPVMRDVHKMGLVEFEKSLADISEKARGRKLSIAEMSGGTFTISNGGVFGSLLSTPILNMPQSAILGLHKTQDRPVAIGGQVVIRPMMYMALSYDHRIIDGREAVSFLVKIKEGIENLDLIVGNNF